MIAGSMARSGMVMNDYPFYIPLPDAHYNFYLTCKRDFGRVYVSG